MVSSNTENGVEAAAPKLPPGKYRVVGFDLDRTGRRLIDEICQIAAYTPNSQFTQYVMPFKDLNVGSKYRHLLRVATVGKYRMLKCAKTGLILKTKSEVSAVTDFVQWLENLKAEGIILVIHDNLKTTPPFLLDVLHKYNLYDRFAAVVKGFANSYFFAEKTCNKIIDSYSLFNLGRTLFGKNEEVHSAALRARLSYQIVQHLCTGEDDKGSGDATSTPEVDNPAMSEAMRLIANSVADEDKELAQLKELVERQNSLRKIFGDKINSRFLSERHRANDLRRLLAEANLTYDNLLEAWVKDKKEGLVALLKERITTTGKPEDIDDVTEILLSHFDPEHYPQVSLRRGRRDDKSQAAANANAQPRGGAGDEAKGGGGDEDKQQQTDKQEQQQPAGGDKASSVTAAATSSPTTGAATVTTTTTPTGTTSGKTSPGKAATAAGSPASPNKSAGDNKTDTEDASR